MAKAVCGAAAEVCNWATHLHFMLIPFDKEVHLRPHQAHPNGSDGWLSERLESIHPTHHATAMYALSAIATVDVSSESQQEQGTCSRGAGFLQQQFSSWSIPVPQQQPAPPQAEVDISHSQADLSISARGSACLLQINMREVLGCGSTGIIFAGESIPLCASTHVSWHSQLGLQATVYHSICAEA